MATSCTDFRAAFKANMDAIGLPVPGSFFDTQQRAVSTVSTILGVAKTFGPRVTIRELIVAGTLPEWLAFAAALYASYYFGGVVGSLIVATTDKIECQQASQTSHFVARWSGRYNVSVNPVIQHVIARHPEILQPTKPNRSVFGRLAIAGKSAAKKAA